MRISQRIRVFVVPAVALALAIGAPLAGPAPDGKSGKTGTQQATTAGKQGKEAGNEAAGARATEERKKIIEEAVTALGRVNLALRHLDRGKTSEALDDLAVAVGKLELIVTRYPELALAPVDVRMITHDLQADVAAIRKLVSEAQDALDDGRVQEARRILRDLGSEIIVRVYNIPLATWPDAIKSVVPLIDQGKVDEAKRAIEEALSTLVIVDHVIPLPVVRAQAWLKQARELAGKEKRTREEESKLADYLAKAKKQLQLAETFGYGSRKDYEKFYDTIDEIARRTSGGGTESGLFDRLRKSIDEFREKL